MIEAVKKGGIKCWIMLGIQVFILLLLVIGLCGKKEDIRLGGDFFMGAGVFDEESGIWHADANQGSAGHFLTSGELPVSSGVYRVQLFYETDTDMVNRCYITDSSAAHREVFSNGDHLYAGLTSTDYEVWVLDGNGSLKIEVEYGGSGSLSVKGARIYNTGGLESMLLFMAVLGFVTIDLLYVYWQKQKEKGFSASQKVTILALLAIIIYSSLPLMTDYIIAGGDLIFHLLRIEGVKDGLLAGQFPVRIAPQWQRGHGYASSVFYGDTMLFVPALLRLMGFPLQTSYKFLLFVLNVGTCLISYYAFKKILNNRYLGIMGSMLYTMSVYRLFKIYHTAALGEAISIMFLPLLVVGFYKIFTEDVKDKNYRWNWILPTIGFCGMIQSHILSTYIVAAFTVFLCLLLWKKVLRKETFLVLASVVVFSGLICAWFLVPFLDYVGSGEFVINHVSARKIQFRGLQVAQLFKIFFNDGPSTMFFDNGMVGAEPAGLGGSLLLGGLLFICLWCTGVTSNLDKKLFKTGKIALLVAVISMVMSTQVFPWDRIQKLHPVTATLVSSLQFTSRFLNISTIALLVVTGIAGVCIWKTEKILWKGGFAAGIAVMFLVSNVYLLNDICDSGSFFRLYNVGGMGTGYISGAEYIPVGTEAEKLTYAAPVAGEGVWVEGYEKDYLSVEMTCRNGSPKESYVDVPILYYEGYRAQTDAGQELEVGYGENNIVRISIPAGFEGGVSMGFVSPWYWRVAEVVSVVTFLALTGGVIWAKRKEQNHE